MSSTAASYDNKLLSKEKIWNELALVDRSQINVITIRL